MAIYKTRPLQVEAFQMIRERRLSNAEWPSWLHERWNMDPDEEGALYPKDFPESDSTDPLMFNSNEGSHEVPWGAYFVHSEDCVILYAQEVFEQLFDLVGSAPR